jgi:S-adenosylmethionine:tRNA ribosyltransferase-isomerase
MGGSRAAAHSEAAPATDRADPSPATSDRDAELRTSDFDYELPDELIALRPAGQRDESRLLAVDRGRRALEDRRFSDFGACVPPGDAVVLNDTRVFPARLVGHKPTGAPAEILLLRPRGGPDDARVWEALVRPGGKLKPGRRVRIADDLEVAIQDSVPGGGRLVRLVGPGDPWTLIERYGHVPLPPYIDRPDDDADGLHFTPQSLTDLEGRGVQIVRLTLHVGVGTFRPVAAEHPAEHSLHAEPFRLSEPAARTLNEVRATGGRIWAVGTTVCRALETAIDEKRGFRATEAETDLFIYPPFRFRAVDHLLTNFHLPRSSLLMLVAALAGHGLTLDAYRHAVRERYRFYSYGDAMLVL